MEDALRKVLASVAKVDGHDCGSGEMNIFIYTDEPENVFEIIKKALAQYKSFSHLVAAFRERTGEQYKVLWPVGYEKPFQIK